VVFGGLVWFTVGSVPREQGKLPALFPSPTSDAEGTTVRP